MTEQNTATDPQTLDPITEEKHRLCLMLYIIFAASLVMQFINLWTVTIGSAAIIAGIIIAYWERKKAYGSLYGNHLQWLIRTFWIGGAVYLPVATLVASIAILFVLDWTAVRDLFSTDADTSIQKALVVLLQSNSLAIYITLTACTAPFALWWWWRCWYGYKRLKAGKPIPNPTSWF